ncbi:hypothetical protein [Brumimicrobium aurantiacum]|uniref:PH domain-containing protein n=1 Tax=Brumimicrobium aurantiacum TaxID=1737063 RepID=A0A3E1EWR6_9FLAO|nr:hypothetical protein [Brumimicrobium aurantiacum]RFC54004.1 hypothetical protein DXU93_10720 [Brumimicrobium aurantiacum]
MILISALIFYPILMILIWIKPFSFIGELQISKRGVHGFKNDLIEWGDIKSFKLKNLRGHHYIMLKLHNGKVFHITSSRSSSDENLTLFYDRFIELKPIESDIQLL